MTRAESSSSHPTSRGLPWWRAPMARHSMRGHREIVGLAWPILAAMLGDIAMGLVDAKLVAGLGPAALGGVGLGIMILFLANSIMYGVVRGVKVCTAHAIGEGRAHHASLYAKAGVAIGILAGVVLWI